MNDPKSILADTESRMKKSLEVVHQHLMTVRTGRANTGMVEHLKVEYYGTMTPLMQVGSISIPEPRTIVISPWDPGALKPIEKAINESNLGIPPIIDGKVVRLVIPPLTRERREELVKVVHKVAEDGRVSLRSIRREANERVKAVEKEKKISEDESFKLQTDIQKLTDRYIQMIDQVQSQKEKDLTQS